MEVQGDFAIRTSNIKSVHRCSKSQRKVGKITGGRSFVWDKKRVKKEESRRMEGCINMENGQKQG